MSIIWILDTDHLSLFQNSHPLVTQRTHEPLIYGLKKSKIKKKQANIVDQPLTKHINNPIPTTTHTKTFISELEVVVVVGIVNLDNLFPGLDDSFPSRNAQQLSISNSQNFL